MIAFNRKPDHAERFRVYGVDLLKPLVNADGRLDGDLEELHKVSRLLVRYMRLHIRRHWPSDSSYAISLTTEVATVAVICLHRCPDSTQESLRPILQSLYHNLTEKIDSRPATISERRNHTTDFGIIEFAARELENRATYPQPLETP